MANLSKFLDFSNGKKRPASEGAVPVYGGNGVLGYADKGNNKNCIAIGRVGAYCGSVYYSPGECWISDNAIAAQVKGDNSTPFFYYLLKHLHLQKRQIGTSQPLLTQGVLNAIGFDAPSPAVQKQIATVLLSLEKLILLNDQINDYLAA